MGEFREHNRSTNGVYSKQDDIDDDVSERAEIARNYRDRLTLLISRADSRSPNLYNFIALIINSMS